MKILVLMKQVPARATLGVDPDTGTLVRDGDTLTNPADERALELALRVENAEITAMTMGPPNAESMLREAAARGAARLVLATDPAFAGGDTLATARTLKAAHDALGGFDLILCGTRAVDGETGQVPPALSALLNIPCLPDAADLSVSNGAVRVERRTQTCAETLSCPLPALCTVSMGAPAPRPPSLAGLRRARNAEITRLTNGILLLPPESCGLAGSPTRVVSTRPVVPERRGARLVADAQAGADLIGGMIREAKGAEHGA